MFVNKNENCESESVVILPGLLCDSRMFEHQVRAFGAQVIDGFYGRARSLGAMADYALARMPERCALLGHSMGARVALEVWRRAPERVARIALCNTGVHPVREGEAAKRYALRDLGRAEGSAALVDAWLPPMIGASNRNDCALFAQLRAMCIDAGVEIFEAQVAALLQRPDTSPVLAAIDRVTFAIAASDDHWSPVVQHEAIVAAVPGAQLRIVNGAGHMAPAEAPALFNEMVSEWLAWPPPGQTAKLQHNQPAN